MKSTTAMGVGLLGILTTGCIAGEEVIAADEGVDVEATTLLGDNALNLNALNLNALNLNALNLNALSIDALSPSALAALRSPDNSGDLARMLLKYAVSCALGPAESIELQWTDRFGNQQVETYQGLMSLAPSWSYAPLSAAGQKWISACLASRVNWYGVQVQLSSRGPLGPLSYADPSETAAFPMLEGAFWGNLFDTSPHVFACHDDSTRDHSRLKLRDCAAGHVEGGAIVECGIIDIIGPCSAHCEMPPGNGGYYLGCGADPTAQRDGEVVTVWLEP